MRPKINKIIFAGLLFSATSLGIHSAARANCFHWAEARPIIIEEGLIPLNVITDTIADRFGGELIKARLCSRDGQFVYKLVVLGQRGRVREVTIDSRTGDRIGVDGNLSDEPTANASAFGGLPKKRGMRPPYRKFDRRPPGRRFQPPR